MIEFRLLLTPPPCVSTMADKSKHPKGEADALSSLNMAIDGLNRVKEATSLISAKTAFTSAGVLLTMIRVRVSFRSLLADLWLMCTGLCDLRGRLRRTRAILRWRLRSAQTGDGERSRRPVQPLCPQGDREIDGVSWFSDAHPGDFLTTF